VQRAVAQVIIARAGQALRGSGVADDGRAQEYHQVGLAAAARGTAEERAQYRDVAQQGDLLAARFVAVVEQAAECHDGTVIDHHVGLDFALVEHQLVAAGADGTVHRGHFLLDRQGDAAAAVDLRAHGELDAHVFAVDGAERVLVVRPQRLAGSYRHLLADQDACFLVVQGQHRRSGQQAGAGIVLHRIDDDPEQAVIALMRQPDQSTTEAQQRLCRGLLRGFADAAAFDVATRGQCTAGEGCDAWSTVGELGKTDRYGAVLAGQQQLGTQFARGLVGDFHHQCFDQHLFAWRIELAHYIQQHALGIRVGMDDQRVGTGIAHDHRTLAGSRRDDLGSGGIVAGTATGYRKRRAGIHRRNAAGCGGGGCIRSLADQLLQYRQQLFGTGVLQFYHRDVAVALRPRIQFQRQLRGALHQCRIAAQQQRVAAVHRQHGQRRGGLVCTGTEQLGQGVGQLPRGGVAQGDGIDAGTVAVDSFDQFEDALEVVGVVGDQQLVALGQGNHHAAAADQRLERFRRGAGIDALQREHAGGEPQWRAGLLRGGIIGYHAVGGRTGRHRDQPIGSQYHQQHAYQVAVGHVLVAADVHRALDLGVDDEGGTGGARHVLDEGRQLHVLHAHGGGPGSLGRLGAGGRNRNSGHTRGDQQQGGESLGHGLPLPRVTVCNCPSRR